jgi:hypothetical protein
MKMSIPRHSFLPYLWKLASHIPSEFFSLLRVIEISTKANTVAVSPTSPKIMLNPPGKPLIGPKIIA